MDWTTRPPLSSTEAVNDDEKFESLFSWVAMLLASVLAVSAAVVTTTPFWVKGAAAAGAVAAPLAQVEVAAEAPAAWMSTVMVSPG